MRPNFDGSLYLVTDRKMITGKSFEEFLVKSVKGGITALQLREKECSTREYINLSKQAIELLRPFGIPVIINDRVDVALAAKAQGVHLGQSDFPFEEARRILGENFIIGVTVESIEQAIEFENQDVDYLGVSSVFPTKTKNNILHVWGIEGLAELRRCTHHKMIAIGGINLANSSRVIHAGADGIAVVSAICESEDPFETSFNFIKSIREARNAI